jgi:hypothetical protein
LKVLWTSEFSHAPFVSTPVLTDANGDGQIDVIGATFTETIKAINIQSGNVLPNLNWPNHLHDASTYSSPIEVMFLSIRFNADSGVMLCSSFVGFRNVQGYPVPNIAKNVS